MVHLSSNERMFGKIGKILKGFKRQPMLKFGKCHVIGSRAEEKKISMKP